MKQCQICKSENDVRMNKKAGKLLCRRHAVQVYRFGEVRSRTLADPNDFHYFNDHYAEMICYDRNGKEKGRTRIDVEDIPRVKSAGSWCIDSGGYVMNGKHGALHRFLMGSKKGYEIDHKNRDKLDNTKANLRFVLHRINTINRNTINAYQRPNGNWTSYVCSIGKTYTLGTFATFKQAQSIANKAKNHLSEGKDIDSFFKELIK